mgnify:FL=1
MKIVQINDTCGVGSTGKICEAISRLLNEKNIENHILYSVKGDGYEFSTPVADKPYIKIQALKSRIFGNYGFNSAGATERIIAKLEELKPDIVHLHNLHGHICNIGTLFDYLKSKNIKIVWTFHDCWAFTGYCMHFVAENCKKWETGCENCPVFRNYSWFSDRSKTLYGRKKRIFEDGGITVVTPSGWLASLAEKSFAGGDVRVINNGIDLSVFRPTESNFREKHGMDKTDFMILCVADNWSVKKGSDDVSKLAEKLPDGFKVVAVGTNSESLSPSVVRLPRTQNQEELVKIYSAADLFVNPTYEDTFPTVNIEALACGTPVLTYLTGGSGEMTDNSCGAGVKTGDFDSLLREIGRISAEKPFAAENCVKKASEYSDVGKFEEYISLYKELVGEKA